LSRDSEGGPGVRDRDTVAVSHGGGLGASGRTGPVEPEEIIVGLPVTPTVTAAELETPAALRLSGSNICFASASDSEAE
jgi:hypothetical protein